jgi:predicted house-cleaning noncanonical NTP pyrophosphatase (MazG superfamily)
MAPAGPRAAGPGSADRGGALPEGFFPPGLKSGRQLVAKLLEEAQEVKSAPADDLTAELVDVLEVLQAMVAAHGRSWEELLSVAAGKRAERGAFADRIFLEYVEQVD